MKDLCVRHGNYFRVQKPFNLYKITRKIDIPMFSFLPQSFHFTLVYPSYSEESGCRVKWERGVMLDALLV